VKHGAGRYVVDAAALDEPQVVLRYAARQNPNGSEDDIAGITNAAGNVLGLMPHPEHAIDPLLGSGDGAYILSSFIAAAGRRALAAA
jgi:phosphoribosylformylglycinamidine synthase